MIIIEKNNILYKISLFYNLTEFRDDRYPDSIFYYKNNNIYFELDLKDNLLWCDNNIVWRVFSEQNTLNYTDTQAIIKKVVEQYTNWGSVTPGKDSFGENCKVEQYTNWGSVTPIDINLR